MEFTGKHSIDASRDHLWTIASDPEILVECVPGAQDVEQVSETHYKGKISREIANISITLEGEVEIAEQKIPTRLVANAVGTDPRTNSRMDAEAELTLMEADGGTELSYTIDMVFSGRLASLGSRIMKRKIEADIDQFFENVRARAETGSS